MMTDQLSVFPLKVFNEGSMTLLLFIENFLGVRCVQVQSLQKIEPAVLERLKHTRTDLYT